MGSKMQNKTEILYILSHSPDNRYKKRFETLRQASQHVIYWNKTGKEQKPTLPIGYESVDIKADQTNPLKRIPETLRFSKEVAKRIYKYRPKVLYVGNLDMLHIAYKYKKTHPEVKVVYEVADLHRLIVDKQRGFKALVRSVLRKREAKDIQCIDILVLTSMKYYDVYYSDIIEQEKTLFLPNMPILSAFHNYDANKHPKEFTIGFFGWIRYLDQLDMLIDAAEETNIKLLFAGSDNSGSSFSQRCKNLDFVEYYGPYDYEKEIAALYERVDCVYSVYNADLFNVRVALPNKLYESVYCEKPIIVAKNTYLAEKVLELGAGFAVDHENVHDLVSVIEKIKFRETEYQTIVSNCKERKSLVNPEGVNEELKRRLQTLLESM